MAELETEKQTPAPATAATNGAAVPAAGAPAKGAARPPLPAPPEERPGKRPRGRPPGSATKPVNGTAAVPSNGTTAPGAPGAVQAVYPWRDPAIMDEARDTARGIAMALHFRFASQGGIGFDGDTGAQFVEAVAPCIAKYQMSGYAPEIGAAIALFSIIPYARQSATEFQKMSETARAARPELPAWTGPMHPSELGRALLAAKIDAKK